MNGVCNQMNWTNVTNIGNLRNIPTESLGPRHSPVNHGDCLDIFQNTLADKNVNFDNGTGLLSKDRLKYVYVCEINVDNRPDLTFTMGFCNYNNKKKSLTGLAGEKVFVCSNEMYTGQIKDYRRRHTAGIHGEVRGVFENTVEQFDAFVKKRGAEIDFLKEAKFGDKQLGDTVLNLHRNSYLGSTNISRIVKEWDNPRHEEFKERTAWHFQNAATEVMKGVTNPDSRLLFCNDIHKFINQAIAA